MSLQTKIDILKFLLGDAGIDSVFGNRIYPNAAPQDAAYPLMVYSVVSGGPNYSHDGESGSELRRWQFDILAPTLQAVELAVDALKSALSGFRGQAGDKTRIDHALIDSEFDFYEHEPRIHRKTVDFQIFTTAI